MKSAADFGLILVTDRTLAGDRPLEEVVRKAVRGGVSIVQLREKACSTREFVVLARRLLEFLRPAGVPLIINDRVDVALAAGADGVHLGRTDMAFGDARRLLGPEAIIGLSVENLTDIAVAEETDADYFAASPVFATPTKTDAGAPWGIEGLQWLRGLTKHTLVAIGGLGVSNAAAVFDAGADGIAVVSAICAAPDPEAAARHLREIADAHRRAKERGSSRGIK
jgi:thiamine-phosphate pyrophosphorylase